MSTRMFVRALSLLLFTFLGALIGGPTAWAVPSFARQTGVACEVCHTSFPELTPFGRRFKLEGYTLTGTPTVGSEAEKLALNATPPLSFMLQVGYTRTAVAQRDTIDATHEAQNGTVLLPQELSLFYAGRISPKIGAFTQITYSGADDHFSIDNTDIRFADTVTMGDSNLVYGVTVNNNPTVQDLWNSTSAWGFPFAATEVAPSPSAAALLDGGLGQKVAGVGGYAGYYGLGGLLYAEYTMYRSSQIGNPTVPLDSSAVDSPVIRGQAPYARVAYEYDFGTGSWEIGATTLHALLVPIDTSGATPVGNFLDTTPTDSITDVAFDTQFQWIAGEQIYGIKAISIKERRNWGAFTLGVPLVDNPQDNLTTTRITATFVHAHSLSFNLQAFTITGDKDAAAYPDSVSTGSPDSAGNVLEVAYTPWLNTRFSLQYTTYSKFNGASNDYNGEGRNAKDNNTTYLLAWFMF
jgi:hypothetical protein